MMQLVFQLSHQQRQKALCRSDELLVPVLLSAEEAELLLLEVSLILDTTDIGYLLIAQAIPQAVR